MAICPECGEKITGDQQFCRNCGETVEERGELRGDEILLYLKNSAEPLQCTRADYNQQGSWVKVQMRDRSSRLYPQREIEYIEAPNPIDDLLEVNLNEEVSKQEVKEVDTWSHTQRFLNSLVGDN